MATAGRSQPGADIDVGTAPRSDSDRTLGARACETSDPGRARDSRARGIADSHAIVIARAAVPLLPRSAVPICAAKKTATTNPHRLFDSGPSTLSHGR